MRNPFAAATVTESVMNVIRRTPQPPSMINPDVPEELDAIVMRALAKDLDARFQSAASMSAELRKVAVALDVRAEKQHSDDFLLPVDDEADKVPPMVWLAGAGGVALLLAALWWSLR